MAQSRVKMRGQLADDFSALMFAMTKMVDKTEGIDAFLNSLNISWEEYEEIKEYLYDKYKVVTYV